jgi:hypothetical protein
MARQAMTRSAEQILAEYLVWQGVRALAQR